MQTSSCWEIGGIYWIKQPCDGERLPDGAQPGHPVELLAIWDTCLFVKSITGRILSLPRNCLDQRG